MISHIKTSKINKAIVTDLTRKLNLGTENIVARIAFAYSIAKDRRFSVLDIEDSQGKEYSKNVLFGNNYPFYLALLCTHYNIHRTNRDISKYFKIHIDDGLKLLNQELIDNPNLNGFDFITDKIEHGLSEFS
jgi:DNA sulfur modification protein DndE